MGRGGGGSGRGESRGRLGVLGLRAHLEGVVSRVDGRRSVGRCRRSGGRCLAGVKAHCVGEAEEGGRVEDGRGRKLGTAARVLRIGGPDPVVSIPIVIHGYVVWFHDDSPSHLSLWPHPQAHYNTSLNGVPGHRLWLTPTPPVAHCSGGVVLPRPRGRSHGGRGSAAGVAGRASVGRRREAGRLRGGRRKRRRAPAAVNRGAEATGRGPRCRRGGTRRRQHRAA